MVDNYISRRPEIRKNEHSIATGILEGDMHEIRGDALCVNPPGTSLNGTGEMCQSPVLTAANDLLCLGIDDQNTTARVWPDVRLAALQNFQLCYEVRTASGTSPPGAGDC